MIREDNASSGDPLGLDSRARVNLVVKRMCGKKKINKDNLSFSLSLLNALNKESIITNVGSEWDREI